MPTNIQLHLNPDLTVLADLADTADPFDLQDTMHEIQHREVRLAYAAVPGVDVVGVSDGIVSKRWKVIEVVLDGFDDADQAQRIYQRLDATMERLVADVLDEAEHHRQRRRHAWPLS